MSIINRTKPIADQFIDQKAYQPMPYQTQIYEAAKEVPLARAAARFTNNPTSSKSSQGSADQATVSDGGWKSRSTTLRVAGS